MLLSTHKWVTTTNTWVHLQVFQLELTSMHSVIASMVVLISTEVTAQAVVVSGMVLHS